MHFDDETDASEAIRKLDGREWGRLGRRLRVEFAKNDANVRAREAARRKAADPNTTLFVAGFDRTIRETDLEKAFEGFGRLKVRKMDDCPTKLYLDACFWCPFSQISAAMIITY